jgi:Raf kinase inhibitor-like YbhB/YbcL family protein
VSIFLLRLFAFAFLDRFIVGDLGDKIACEVPAGAVLWVLRREETMQKFALGAMVLAFAALSVSAASAQMKLTSDDIKNNAVGAKEMEANVFGCDGGSVSPSLRWTGAPAGTKSFAINLYDPDAPTGGGFWHWVVFNIPVGTTSLPKNAGDVKAKLMPGGAMQSRNDYGFDGYGGMCPPKGDKPHRYILTVYAVDEDELQFAKDDMVSPAIVGYELHFHSKATATLQWTYGRPK